MTNAITKVKQELSRKIEFAKEAMPTGTNSKRLMINACSYISTSPKLMEACESQPQEVTRILFNLVATGLDLGNNEAYILPFKSRNSNKFTLTVVKDYKGLMKQARAFSVEPIANIISRVVYKGDKYNFTDKGYFRHEFDPFKIQEKYDIIGVYCSIIFKNGTEITEFLNMEEIEKVKNSTPFQNKIWEQWTDAMMRKTAVRKAMKYISLDFGSEKALEINSSLDKEEFNQVVEPKPIQKEAVVEPIVQEAVVVEPMPQEAVVKENTVKEIDLLEL